jgi:8-oxo-dGTP pyrophosphatase MutT (NUDIX family)
MLGFDTIHIALSKNLKRNYSTSPDYHSIVQDKIAGVLVIIHGSDSKPSILFTKRSENLKIHASEISFPGGNFVIKDLNPLNTALRETREEIGIDISPEFVLGALEPVQTLTSNYFIYPYVAMLERMPHTQPNEEVQEIFSIPVENLLRANPKNIVRTINAQPRQSQPISWENNIIWGATARILRFLLNRLE